MESPRKSTAIKYQLAIAKLPLAKDIDDFAFKGTPINEGLVRDLAGGGFIDEQRNAVFIGGTGTGKSHLAIAIARSRIRAGSRGRFFASVDLVNRLEAETRGLAPRPHRRFSPPHGLRRPRRARRPAVRVRPAGSSSSASSAGS
jgi:DNA replication protein DnaC